MGSDCSDHQELGMGVCPLASWTALKRIAALADIGGDEVVTVHDTANICVRILGLDLGSDCITVEGNSEGSSRDSHKSELADAVASNDLFQQVLHQAFNNCLSKECIAP